MNSRSIMNHAISPSRNLASCSLQSLPAMFVCHRASTASSLLRAYFSDFFSLSDLGAWCRWQLGTRLTVFQMQIQDLLNLAGHGMLALCFGPSCGPIVKDPPFFVIVSGLSSSRGLSQVRFDPRSPSLVRASWSSSSFHPYVQSLVRAPL